MADIDDKGVRRSNRAFEPVRGSGRSPSESLALKKYLPNIAQNLSFIKSSLSSLVKMQEMDKKTQYFERQKRRSEDYSSRYKKVKPTREDKKVVSTEKKSFFDIIKDGLSNIFKFALLGLVAIGASKLLSLPGVMDGLKSFFKKFILGVSDLIQKGVGFLRDLLKDSEIISSITKLIKTVFIFIADGISKAADIFKSIISDPANKESIGKIIVAVIGTVFTGLMSAVEIAGKVLSENQEAIKNGIVTIFVKIAEGLSGAVAFVDLLIKDPKFVEAAAKIYEAVKSFIETILNEPLGTIDGFGPVNLKMVFIALGAGFVALEGAMAILTGKIIAKAVGQGMGMSGAGGVPGDGGGTGAGGKKTGKQKLLGALGTVGNVALSGAGIYAAYKGVTEFSAAKDEATKRDEERKLASTSPVRVGQEGFATSAQKTSAVSSAKEFAGKTGADFIASMEGFAGKAYLDPPGNQKNQYSVGYGHLITEAEVKQGFINLGDDKKIEVKGPGGKDTIVSKEDAKALLNSDLPKYEAIASKGIGADAWQKLNQDQRNSLTSLAYNGGAGQIAYLVKNGLKEAILKGDMEGASKIIYEKGYKMSGGKLLAGLDTRRLKEATLFAGTDSQIPIQMAGAPGAAPPAPPTPNPSPITPPTAETFKRKESIGDMFASMLTQGPTGDFLKQLDDMTGGKLGVASGELASVLRTRGLFEPVSDVIDGSTNVSYADKIQDMGPIPSIYDETLLSKLSLA